MSDDKSQDIKDKVVVDTDDQEPKAEAAVVVAKAGRRSAKGQAEEKAKDEKIAAQKDRVKTEAEAQSKPVVKHNPTRTRLQRSGKKLRAAAAKIDKSKAYTVDEAIKLTLDSSVTSFDSTVELHVNLNVDPRQADQNIRDSIILPAGTGKKVRVAVFSDDKIEGADFSGVDKITAELSKGQISFDVLISTPANMPKLGKYARLLGPRGLMPNPKSGTVTTDLDKALSEAKAGRVEYRVDSNGIIHLGIGKVSFGPEKVKKNLMTVLAALRAAKPASVKSNFIKSVHLATSMGPSIEVSTSDF